VRATYPGDDSVFSLLERRVLPDIMRRYYHVRNDDVNGGDDVWNRW
jgi:hypothetical protein